MTFDKLTLSKYSPSLSTSSLVNASVVFDATFSPCYCNFNPSLPSTLLQLVALLIEELVKQTSAATASYLIFVTGATGGARVNFFARCKFLQIKRVKNRQFTV